MKIVFISSKLWQIAVISLCFMLFSAIKLNAQVKIGYEATKLKTSPSAIILQLSNDTSNNAASKAAKALILSNVKTSQEKATNSSMQQGLFHYNVDTNLFAFSRNKEAAGQNNNKGAEWKYLRYDQDGNNSIQFVKIEKSDLTDSKIPKEDGTECTIIIEKKHNKKTLFVPHQRKNNNNSKMHTKDNLPNKPQTTTTNNETLMPRTRICYNGYTLSPNKDYTIELENSTNTSTQQRGDLGTLSQRVQDALKKQKIKITFLTLVPEKWEEFDEFFIEYEVI